MPGVHLCDFQLAPAELTGELAPLNDLGGKRYQGANNTTRKQCNLAGCILRQARQGSRPVCACRTHLTFIPRSPSNA